MVEMFNPVIYPLKVWVGIDSKEMSKVECIKKVKKGYGKK